MQDAQMNAWKNWANKRNAYDDAYVLGYGAGYHKDKYVNSYDKDTEAQYWIKFKHGYTAGKMLRVKEEGESI